MLSEAGAISDAYLRVWKSGTSYWQSAAQPHGSRHPSMRSPSLPEAHDNTTGPSWLQKRCASPATATQSARQRRIRCRLEHPRTLIVAITSNRGDEACCLRGNRRKKLEHWGPSGCETKNPYGRMRKHGNSQVREDAIVSLSVVAWLVFRCVTALFSLGLPVWGSARYCARLAGKHCNVPTPGFVGRT